MLTVDYQESTILDVLPPLGLYLEEPVSSIHRCQAYLLPLLHVNELNELLLYTIYDIPLQGPNDILRAGKYALRNVYLHGEVFKKKILFVFQPEVSLNDSKLFKIRHWSC